MVPSHPCADEVYQGPLVGANFGVGAKWWALWPDLCQWGMARLSLKRRRGTPFQWAHHPQDGPKGSSVKRFGWQLTLGTLVVPSPTAEASSRVVECHLSDEKEVGAGLMKKKLELVWEIEKFRLDSRPHLDTRQGLWNRPSREGLDFLPLWSCRQWQETGRSGDSCCPLVQCLYIGVYPSEREGSLPPPSGGGTIPDCCLCLWSKQP